MPSDHNGDSYILHKSTMTKSNFCCILPCIRSYTISKGKSCAKSTIFTLYIYKSMELLVFTLTTLYGRFTSKEQKRY